MIKYGRLIVYDKRKIYFDQLKFFTVVNLAKKSFKIHENLNPIVQLMLSFRGIKRILQLNNDLQSIDTFPILDFLGMFIEFEAIYVIWLF